MSVSAPPHRNCPCHRCAYQARLLGWLIWAMAASGVAAAAGWAARHLHSPFGVAVANLAGDMAHLAIYVVILLLILQWRKPR